MGLGLWGQRWVESQLSLRNLDPTLLMWDMRRHLMPELLPPRKCTIQFQYPELPRREAELLAGGRRRGASTSAITIRASRSIFWCARR